MKSKILLAAMAVSMLVYVLSSCYRNKEDILALPRVSFRKRSRSYCNGWTCGCHNAAVNVRAVLFSDPRINTIYYDAILARRSQFDAWVNGGTHPEADPSIIAPNPEKYHQKMD